tara:strand:+ start:419 stop:730 length:312 start_codon:yes stop_codon:yes gene_type:complete
MKKNVIYLLFLIYLTTSCGGNTFDSVKRGLTGEKRQSADEFLIEKKDPLVLPPDYENLPDPSDEIAKEEEMKIFEKTFQTSMEDSPASTGSVEQSILEKIRSK